jgi:hypothetical protein
MWNKKNPNSVIMPPIAAVNYNTNFNNAKKHLLSVAYVAVSLLIVVSLTAFGVWAYSQMQDYKNNSDKKVAVAVQQAQDQLKTSLDQQYADQSKSPSKTYTAPAAFGGVVINYPKTWSAYINEQTASTGTVVDAYFYQDYLPSVSSSSAIAYNLRVQIVDGSYQDIVNRYSSQIKDGKITATPYTPANVPGASTGVRLVGQLTSNKKGAMVIIPLRDKVLELWTETQAGIADFDTYVIAKLSFSP